MYETKKWEFSIVEELFCNGWERDKTRSGLRCWERTIVKKSVRNKMNEEDE